MSSIVMRACLAVSTLCCVSADLAYAQDKKIYWTELGSNKIRRANLDGSNIEDVVDAAPRLPEFLAIHEARREMYWANFDGKGSFGSIERATLWGQRRQKIVERLGDGIGVALDIGAGKVYWTDPGDHFTSTPITIRRADLDGSNTETLVAGSALAGRMPFGIAIDPVAGKMYWTVYGSSFWPGAVKRADLDGSNIQTLVMADLFAPAGIAVDPVAQRVYWTDAFTDKIQQANADGTGVEDVYTGDGPRGLWVDLDAGKLYWTEAFQGKIRRANLDGTGVEDVITGGLDTPRGIAVVSTAAALNIPTVSTWGLAVLLGSLCTIGVVMVRRQRARGSTDNKTDRIARYAIAAVSLLSLEAGRTAAQPATIPVEVHNVSIDSGPLSIPIGRSGPEVVFQQLIQMDGASGIRLHFGSVQLAGQVISTQRSYIRITSTTDGAVQILDGKSLAKWHYKSAYFNGDEVLLEVVAFPGIGVSTVTVDKVVVELGGYDCPDAPGHYGYCGGTDERVASNDPRAARFRYYSVGQDCGHVALCTAFLIENRPNWLLTAGHCCATIETFQQCPDDPLVEFNVPPSTPDGAFQHADPSDQYDVHLASIQLEPSVEVTDGNDWCLFGVLQNSTTGKMPLEVQNSSFRLARELSSGDQSTLRVTGYGSDDDPLENCSAQQTSTGPYTAISFPQVYFEVDVSIGNSGSAIEHECRGLVYGIVEAAGCDDPLLGYNRGTAITTSGLRDALTPNEIDGGTREPIGICADCNNNGIHDDLDVAPGGGSDDCNANGIPDECDFDEDCQPNGVQDICDIAAATSRDLDGNKIPDECEAPIGACCMGGGGCHPMRESCCDEVDGPFIGHGVDCNDLGACCSPLGACSFSHATICACLLGRQFAGSGTTCGVMRACCFPDTQNCIVTTQSCCNAQGGIFKPGKLTCDLTACPAIQGPSGP